MNYPIWLTGGIGGGTLIAVISILHVYVSHLAVGGGLLIWLLDRKAYLTGDERLEAFLKRYNWIFLLTTVVFGAVSGVGIWFIIALVHPSATSALIHSFVFGWAMEWVFFIGEISAILIYNYFFDRLERQTRLKIAFLYALFAWLSLFIINGILAFMLTPGKWLETHNFWKGFFNPSFFSSLFFRTFIAFIMAGISTFVIGAFQKDEGTRLRAVRIGVKWVIYAIIGLVLSAVWYYYSLPETVRSTAFTINPETMYFLRVFLAATPVLLIIALLYAFKAPALYQRILAVVTAVIGLLWMGGYEYSREIARKPFIIRDYMYVNSVLVQDVDKLNTEGFLANAKWPKVKTADADGVLAQGKELFVHQCYSCHTIGGIRNDILRRTKDFTYEGILAQLTGQGKVRDYMPPFFGTQEEKEALAQYIIFLHSRGKTAEPAKELDAASIIRPDTVQIPAKSPDYVLLAWSTTGMRMMQDDYSRYCYAPPGNTIEAVLIKRGDPPLVVKDGMQIDYRIDHNYEHPENETNFWKYTEGFFGKKLESNIHNSNVNTGLTDMTIKGQMKFDQDRSVFFADGIPVISNNKDDKTPYIEFLISAYNPDTLEKKEESDAGKVKVIAETKVVVPVTMESGCNNCHGADYSRTILQIHDRNEGTVLWSNAETGKPALCQSCHGSAKLNQEGDKQTLSFSTAMHGWHANYIDLKDETACEMCHPAGEDSYTRFFRGVHRNIEGGCVKCHGSMSYLAASLLNKEIDRPAAKRLLKYLQTAEGIPAAEVPARTGWSGQPDCISCHKDFAAPDSSAVGYEKLAEGKDAVYHRQTDNAGLPCAACHGPAHAEYPAANVWGKDLDVMQPLQYMGLPYPIGSNMNCKVCHTVQYEESVHHENMARKFRNLGLGVGD